MFELMTMLAIAGILGTIAAPGFVELKRNSERTAAVNSFFHSLFLARSEAVKRNSVVTLCKSLDGKQCSYDTTSWAQGYIVFHNADRDDPALVDAGEEVLQVISHWTGGRITANRKAFSFRPHTQAVVNGTVVFCDPRGSEHARAIIISHTGRPRISQRDASNKKLVCS